VLQYYNTHLVSYVLWPESKYVVYMHSDVKSSFRTVREYTEEQEEAGESFPVKVDLHLDIHI
jgi:hypothetical protein